MYPLGLEPKLDGVGGRNVIQLHYGYVQLNFIHIAPGAYNYLIAFLIGAEAKNF